MVVGKTSQCYIFLRVAVAKRFHDWMLGSENALVRGTDPWKIILICIALLLCYGSITHKLNEFTAGPHWQYILEELYSSFIEL